MSDLRIREATADDAAAVLALISQSDMSPDTQLTVEEIGELMKVGIQAGNQELYVAMLGSTIAGTFSLIIIQHLSHNAARSLIIEDVVVHSDLQGRGVGKAMMDFAVERGRCLGCYKMGLSSGKSRTEAHAFYEKLGFEKHGCTFYLNT